jgi:hypothetical protein
MHGKTSLTVGMLAYKDPKWAAFALEGLRKDPAFGDQYKVIVLGNDPTLEMVESGLLTHVFRNPDPNEYYLNRVYRAWNHLVKICETELVVLMNSDMYVSDYWLQNLINCYEWDQSTLPCSLLVESGRIGSGMPEYARNLGMSPESFDRQAFTHLSCSLMCAAQSREHQTEPGRLFMPVLLRRSEFLELGGYPEGNVNGVPGDQILFNKYKDAGYKHITVKNSVVYHVQEGEMRG